VRRLSTADPGFDADFHAFLAAPRARAQQIDATVAEIIRDVRARGDAALIDYSARFDGVVLTPERLRVTDAEIQEAITGTPTQLLDAVDFAATRIEAFHRAQMPTDLRLDDDAAGLTLGMRWTSLDAVGIYVPGGKAAYPSSVLMGAIPAQIAAVERIVMCVPSPQGVLNSLVLAAAHRAGVTEIYRLGGAHAIAALAYGTRSIPPVDRVVGPGNAYVAEAKRQVFGQVGIDSIAGPSEVVVLADAAQNPRCVAIDLLAQAEHDESAQAILITDDDRLAEAVLVAVAEELSTLPRAAIARESWTSHGALIRVRSWAEAAGLVDRIAPEHLQLMLTDPEPVFAQIRHAGAVFLGAFCPEALGDYAAGPNHVLPTGRTARFASGLSVFDFLKRTTWISADQTALKKLGPAVVALAEAEGLQAHARSITHRLGQN
jgi:histidinol dehydrogenase